MRDPLIENGALSASNAFAAYDRLDFRTRMAGFAAMGAACRSRPATQLQSARLPRRAVAGRAERLHHQHRQPERAVAHAEHEHAGSCRAS